MRTFSMRFPAGFLQRRACLTISAGAEERPDLVVVAEEGNKKLSASILEDKSEIAVTAAFEKFVS
jgi:hypothetical protein